METTETQAQVTTPPGHWLVYDLNQRGEQPRVHEAGGKHYPLWSQRGTPVPAHVAVVFLRDPSFRVVDEGGAEQITLPDAENLDSAKRRPTLEPGQTIAKFEELTATALLARAALRPGGSVFNSKTKREALVEFLKSAPVLGELPEHLKPRGTGSVDDTLGTGGETMSDDQTKKLLEGG